MKTAPSPRVLLQWTFQRHGRFLTCEVTFDPHGRNPFALAMMTHHDRADDRIETFDSSLDALQRHASITKALRAAGWMMASYGPGKLAAAQAA